MQEGDRSGQASEAMCGEITTTCIKLDNLHQLHQLHRIHQVHFNYKGTLHLHRAERPAELHETCRVRALHSSADRGEFRQKFEMDLTKRA